MLKAALAVFVAGSAVLGSAVLVAAPAQAEGNPPVVGGEGSATPDTSGGAISVKVTTTGTTSGGSSFSSSTTGPKIQPPCWFERGKSGYEYYEFYKPGGPGRGSDTIEDWVYGGGLHDNFEDYKDIKDGYWYEVACTAEAAASGYQSEFYVAHPAIWVGPQDPAPVTQVDVDPTILRDIALDYMDLPVGTMHWNPQLRGSGATIVGADTWVWVDDAPTTAMVRAEVPGTWAQIDASLTGLKVSSDGAQQSAECGGTGTPWAAGAQKSCSIQFSRSTANQPVKSGQKLPTWTVTAQSQWAATWTSSDNANPEALTVEPPDPTTAEIPVMEVQSLTTS